MKERDKPKIISAVYMLLSAIEGEPLRNEILETPYRVQGVIEEMLSGYNVDIDSLFKFSEGEGKDQIVAVTDIRFTSWCEHHLMPWQGIAYIAYLPVEKVVGISKIGRLVLAYAHRLTLQERLTKQIAYTLMEKLQPQGVGVVIIGKHSCMRCRGVKVSSAKVICSEMLGEFREDKALRQEFFSLLRVK